MPVTLVPLSVQPQGSGQAQIATSSAALTAVPLAFLSTANATNQGMYSIMRFATTFAPANGSNVADLVMLGGDNNKSEWQLILYTVTAGALS